MSELPPLHVAIMSHREIVARGTAALLSERPDRVLLVTLDNITDWRQRVDVAMYDVALMHTLGEAHLTRVAARLGGRVVGLAHDAGTPVASRAVVLGAAGCLGLDASPAELIEAVRTVGAGGRLPELGGIHSELTPQERAIVALVAEGRSNSEIAHRLYISANTLKSHIRSAYRKMGVQSRPEAVAWCARHGLASLELAGS